MPLIKHRKTAGQPKKTAPDPARLAHLRDLLVSVERGLKTSTVSYSKARLNEALAALDAIAGSDASPVEPDARSGDPR